MPNPSVETKEGLPVSEAAVEAAALVLIRLADTTQVNWRDGTRQAIQAFLTAEGLRVQERNILSPESRLVSPWKPSP